MPARKNKRSNAPSKRHGHATTKRRPTKSNNVSRPAAAAPAGRRAKPLPPPPPLEHIKGKDIAGNSQRAKRITSGSVNDWVADKRKPTIVLSVDDGDKGERAQVLLCAGKKQYDAAVAERRIAFSPLEVVEIIAGHNAERDGLMEKGTTALAVTNAVRTKAAFPGARLQSISPPCPCGCGR